MALVSWIQCRQDPGVVEECLFLVEMIGQVCVLEEDRGVCFVGEHMRATKFCLLGRCHLQFYATCQVHIGLSSCSNVLWPGAWFHIVVNQNQIFGTFRWPHWSDFLLIFFFQLDYSSRVSLDICGA